MIPDETQILEHWRSFLHPDASRDSVADEERGDLVITIDRAERAAKSMPVFFRACQGHSCVAHGIERMYAPCEFGMARCRGHLLHVTPLETMQESTLGAGTIKYPNMLSGLQRLRTSQINTDEARVPSGIC
eukprot:3568730-Pyramimonas_sp.AAC.1